MKKIINFILLLLSIGLRSQSLNVDSLVNVLETQNPTINEKLYLYDKIAEYYSQSNAEKSLLYGKEGLRIANKEKDKRMIARNSVNIGAAFLMTPSLDSSFLFLNQAVKLSVELEDKEIQARAYSVLGVLYGLQGKNEEALNHNLKSLALYEKIGNKPHVVRLNANISTFYGQMNQNERALHYLKTAQMTLEEMEVENPILKSAIYELLGGYYLRTGDYERALENSLIALDLSRDNNLKRYELVTTQYLAAIYSDGFQDYKKAEEYALECVKVAESTESKEFMIAAWNILAKIYIDSKKYEKAKHIALKIWNTDSTTVYTAINTAYSLAVCNTYLGDKEKALYYYAKHDCLRVKEAEKELHNSIADMEVKYETEKKETRIAVLEKEKTLYIWLGVTIAVACLSIIVLLFYRHRLTAQKKKLAEQKIIQLEQEKELITIQSSLKAEKTERDLIAHDLHDSVSSLLTVVKNNMNLYADSEHTKTDYFNNAFEVLSKSITELRRVVYHLKSFILIKEGLTAALDDFCRFIPNAEFHFSGLNHRFDPDKEYVLYDCACELINNALKHSEASKIDVHLNMDEHTVYLSVADNGIGFDHLKITPGIGIENIRSNLSAFSGHLDILSEPEKGTEANIEMEI